MAYTTGDAPRNYGFGKKFAGAFSAIFTRVGELLMAFSEAQSRSHQIQRLQAMSDEALAKRGLSRDRIVHHVFRDQLYL